MALLGDLWGWFVFVGCYFVGGVDLLLWIDLLRVKLLSLGWLVGLEEHL